MFSVEVWRAEELGACSSHWQSGGQRHWRGWYRWGRCVRCSRKRGVVRVTRHKTPGESSVNIIVSSYDATHLQENSQRLG